MKYQLRTRGDGLTEVVNIRTGAIVFIGSVAAARDEQATRERYDRNIR